MTLEAQLSKVIEESIKQTESSQALVDTAIKSMDKIDEFSAKTEQVFNLSKDNSDALTQWHTTTQDTVQFKQHDGKTYAVDSLKTLIGKADAIRPHEAAMTKAQFDALREIRKQQYAGSGFAEWGRHSADIPDKSVNEGMWQWINSSFPNKFIMGEAKTHSNTGVSRSIYPKLLIDGVMHHVLSVVSSTTRSIIEFPPAPDGTKTYDSSTGAITKHASVNEAFEGVISNGDFRHGNDGSWQQLNDIRISNTGADFASTQPNKELWQDIEVAHTDYKVSFMANQAGKLQLYIYGEGEQDGAIDVDVKKGFNQFTIKASERNQNFRKDHAFLIRDSSGTKFNGIISQISVMPTSQSVVTSRKDLVFLESWHENIADKDIVYPFGNVQFSSKKYEGITLEDNLVPQGYSAFGEWDKKTLGYGTKWSALSDTKKAEFLSKPEHNIYYDPEAKAYIQVRYRLRVIEGHGDNWESVNEITLGKALIYSHKPIQAINPRGQLSFSSDYTNNYGSGCFHDAMRDDAGSNRAKDVGVWTVNNIHEKYAHHAKCHATPIALVQRMNQGAYHPEFNPLGARRHNSSVGAVNGQYWYGETAVQIVSKYECFNYVDSSTDNTSRAAAIDSGTISSARSGRTDQYDYYDAIYAGQVEDLRLNANKLDVNQLREDAIRKAVAGKMRGKGKVPFTREAGANYTVTFNNGTFIYASLVDLPSYILSNDEVTVYNVTKNSTFTANFFRADPRLQNFGGSSVASVGDELRILHEVQLSPEFDSLPWVDIIGDPERIAATFPDGVVGQWVPQIPTNPETPYPLNVKSSVSTATQIYTTDDGASWFKSGKSIDNIKNEVTLSGGLNGVILEFYESPSYFTEPHSNAKVIGNVDSVWAGNDARIDFGNRLQSSLTNKVGTTVAYTTNINMPVTGHSIYQSQHDVKDGLTSGEHPTHTALPHLGGTDGNSAAKALPTITEKNGLYYLQLHGAEMQYKSHQAESVNSSVSHSYAKGKVYRFTEGAFKGLVVQALTSLTDAIEDVCYVNNGDIIGIVSGNAIFKAVNLKGSWGDDQTIQIFNGENIKTDQNGNSVKAFCHHTLFPIGVAHTQ